MFFLCFFVWPIWEILRGGFIDVNGNFTLAYFIEVFKSPIYMEGLRNSFALAVCSTLLTILIAIPLAFISDRYNFPFKGVFTSMVLLPIMLPPFVGAMGVLSILGEYGAFNAFLHTIHVLPEDVYIDWLGEGRFFGMVLLNAFSLYPILYLNAVASLSNIDPSMEEAAENLGCRGFKRFFTITLPLMRSGLFAGCTIIFIWSFTELGVPLIFDYNRIMPVHIFNGLRDIGNSPFPYALVTAMLLFSVFFYILGKGLFGRKSFPMMAKASHGREPKTPGVLGKSFCFLFFGGVTFIALLPHLAVILISFSSDWFNTLLPTGWTLQNYDIALSNPLTIPSIQNSLIYAGSATMLNCLLGVCIAYIVVRTKLPGRNLLDTMTMLPLAVPGLVMAFGYFAMCLEGKFFSFLNPIENPTALLIIAYAMRKMPFMVRSTIAGLQQTSVTYEEAAQNLGCSPVKSAMRITMPLIMVNILAGGLLAFSKSMLEVSDSLLLAQKQVFFPITKAIYTLMNLVGDGPFLACALGVWAMAFLAVTIIGASVLMGQKLGAIFRL
ncbi:MAG TPA: ABC transporter permease [Opitutae bacterium]|nr:ABC transporter permease [Opitutae bacterium]